MKTPKPHRLPSGNWFVQLRLGGESISITETSEKKCNEQARLIKAEYLAGKRQKQVINDKLFRVACTEYIDRRRSRLSPSTIQGYEKVAEYYFQDLMDTRMDEITWDLVDDAISKECAKPTKTGKPRAPKTVRNAFMFVSSVLRFNKIRFDEPFRLPEVKRKPAQILPAEDVFEAVKGTDIELPCLLAMWLTMSISEIRGLTKSHSIRNGQITIVETVVDIRGKPVRKEGGKEVERTRVQNIPPYIQGLIDKVEGDVLCTLSAGAINERLKRRLIKFGLPPISFHKLRHIAASTMAALNIPANYAQERGGWKTDHVMKAVYTHTFARERLDADKKMDDHFASIVQNANENANEIQNPQSI